jgi:hypothetical protein
MKPPEPPIIDLRPCPFCGGRASGIQPYGTFERDSNGDRIDKGDFIDCIECGASIVRAGGNGISVERRRAALVRGWNRRPSDPDVISDIKNFVKEKNRPAWEEPNWDYAAIQLANALGACWPDANSQMAMQAYKHGLKSAYQLGRKSIPAEGERYET